MFRKPGFLQRVDEDLKKAYAESKQEFADSLDILKSKEHS
jgi:hypothetical protein